LQVAIEGCCHGELDAIYASIARAEREKGFKVDLLLICGDFQVDVSLLYATLGIAHVARAIWSGSSKPVRLRVARRSGEVQSAWLVSFVLLWTEDGSHPHQRHRREPRGE
jgi:hypothetical protein